MGKIRGEPRALQQMKGKTGKSTYLTTKKKAENKRKVGNTSRALSVPWMLLFVGKYQFYGEILWTC